ncbi:hypothetical protein K7X08_030939 [Anisodus acutangulus]|uniref:Uncharacterized protein n=1 Tax=Anisodus acutangulus TaxID=402998 RepID=A0A9Q1MUG0_9SOLA|nr:hypothetical protein K7X08_030939 [Anisodus acutangulus]
MQTQHDQLEASFFEERAAREAKYQKLYLPLYTKGFEIVNGVEVDGPATQDAAADREEDKDAVEKGVPDFWLTAMKNNEVLAEEDIKWSRIENPKCFKLEFFFETNPYFKNAVLTKTYHMIDEDEPILENAIGTEIEWYPGKCLTEKILKKKPKKGSKNATPITKTEQCESFLFFSPPQAEELQNLMEQDYDIGSTIRDKIIPHAVSWFTGEAAEDDYVDLEDDEDEEDEDELEDDEDEDDEDEHDTKTKKKSSAVRKFNHCNAIFFVAKIELLGRPDGTLLNNVCLLVLQIQDIFELDGHFHPIIPPEVSVTIADLSRCFLLQ